MPIVTAVVRTKIELPRNDQQMLLLNFIKVYLCTELRLPLIILRTCWLFASITTSITIFVVTTVLLPCHVKLIYLYDDVEWCGKDNLQLYNKTNYFKEFLNFGTLNEIFILYSLQNNHFLMHDVPQLFPQQIESDGQGLSVSLHCSLNQMHWTAVSIKGHPLTGFGLHLCLLSTHHVPQLSPQQTEPIGQRLSDWLHCSFNQKHRRDVLIGGHPLIGLGSM